MKKSDKKTVMIFSVAAVVFCLVFSSFFNKDDRGYYNYDVNDVYSFNSNSPMLVFGITIYEDPAYEEQEEYYSNNTDNDTSENKTDNSGYDEDTAKTNSASSSDNGGQGTSNNSMVVKSSQINPSINRILNTLSIITDNPVNNALNTPNKKPTNNTPAVPNKTPTNNKPTTPNITPTAPNNSTQLPPKAPSQDGEWGVSVKNL